MRTFVSNTTSRVPENGEKKHEGNEFTDFQEVDKLSMSREKGTLIVYEKCRRIRSTKTKFSYRRKNNESFLKTLVNVLLIEKLARKPLPCWNFAFKRNHAYLMQSHWLHSGNNCTVCYRFRLASARSFVI